MVITFTTQINTSKHAGKDTSPMWIDACLESMAKCATNHVLCCALCRDKRALSEAFQVYLQWKRLLRKILSTITRPSLSLHSVLRRRTRFQNSLSESSHFTHMYLDARGCKLKSSKMNHCYSFLCVSLELHSIWLYLTRYWRCQERCPTPVTRQCDVTFCLTMRAG